MAEIRVIARLIAAEGKADEVRQVSLAMLKPTHAEEGNEFYELYESNEGNRFFFNELWADQDAFDQHIASTHFKKFDAAVKPLLAEPLEINFLKELK